LQASSKSSGRPLGRRKADQAIMRKGGEVNTKSNAYSRSKKRTPTRRDTVLLVEDDQSTLNVLYYFLRRSGYEVIGASSVAEAEWLIGVMGSENISAIISDINLTSGSREQEGYAFYKRWISKDPALVFILISGDPTARQLPAIRSKDVCFLTKPFNLYTLLSTIRSVTAENHLAVID
jgi:DNA-binding NtrC family response regulator